MSDKNIYKKLEAMQKNIVAKKSQYNSFGKYKYRKCEDILEAAKPLLQGCTITINDDVVEVAGRIYVKATATISDGDGSISCSAMAREALTKKGMDESQITGAASSYARKYALGGLLMVDDNQDADAQQNENYATILNDINSRKIYFIDKIKGCASIDCLKNTFTDAQEFFKKHKARFSEAGQAIAELTIIKDEMKNKLTKEEDDARTTESGD